jgi:hypothetical protein
MNIPDRLPKLASGAHDSADREVCAMEAAAWLANEEHSDSPKCVHPVLAAMARNVNDSVDDETRQTLWPLLIRCLGTASDDKVLSVRLAAWCAEQVLDLVRPGDWQVCRNAITAAQLWADNPCEETSNAAYDVAYAAAYAVANNVAYAASNVAYAVANVAYAAYAAAYAVANNVAYASNAAYAVAYAAYAAYAAANNVANVAYAAYAAYAVANVAYAAYAVANAASPEGRVQFLSDLIDECYRLQGKSENEVTEQDWDRLLEFTQS